VVVEVADSWCWCRVQGVEEEEDVVVVLTNHDDV
jgi:hypothetical protein